VLVAAVFHLKKALGSSPNILLLGVFHCFVLFANSLQAEDFKKVGVILPQKLFFAGAGQLKQFWMHAQHSRVCAAARG
jgi:hypothetical protein